MSVDIEALCWLKASGNTKSFICPYHAWSYNLDGELRRAPLIEDRTDFDQRELPVANIFQRGVGRFYLR